MKLVFYNHWHNGDIFVSRGFVNFIINNSNFESYHYVHKNSNNILKDIPVITNNESLQYLDKNSPYFNNTYEMYLNTWYGSNTKHFSGCNFNSLYLHFNEFCNKILNINMNNYDPTIFLPDLIDTSLLHINNINIDNFKMFDKKVFICNNDVLSEQSVNFDFNEIISELCIYFPNYLFIISNKKNILTNDSFINSRIKNKIINLLHYNNLIYSADIINIDGNDLLENSYLSTFCDIIIGRNSGAYTFANNKENLLNKNKKFISISENKIESIWYTDRLSEVVWTNNYNDIINFLKNNIK
jgi:hypothetical protein